MIMNYSMQEEDRLATPAEAVDEWRFAVGPERQEDAWLLHDRDVWVKNPFYQGPPVPHPEDEDLYHDWLADQAADRAAQVDDLGGMQDQIDSEARAEDDRWVADQAGRLWQDESADEGRNP